MLPDVLEETTETEADVVDPDVDGSSVGSSVSLSKEPSMFSPCFGKLYE